MNPARAVDHATVHCIPPYERVAPTSQEPVQAIYLTRRRSAGYPRSKSRICYGLRSQRKCGARSFIRPPTFPYVRVHASPADARVGSFDLLTSRKRIMHDEAKCDG